MRSVVDDRAAVPRRLLVARWQARAPRAAVMALAVVLSLLGLRQLLAGPPAPAPTPPPDQTPLIAISGLAQTFARAYLTYDGGSPEAHDRALAALPHGEIPPDAGLTVPPGASQRILWTTAVSVEPDGPHQWNATVAVAVATDGQPAVLRDRQSVALRYLVVPVTEARPGGLAIAGYPALVAMPAWAAIPDARTASPAPRGASIVPLSDSRLTALVRRALASYLAGRCDALTADLLPGTAVPCQALGLRLLAVERLGWLAFGRELGALVTARDARGVTYELRYELAVVRRGRWYVAALEPPQKGASQ